MGSLRIVVVACVALLALLLWQAVPQPAAPAGSRAGSPAAAAGARFVVRGARVFDGERTWPALDVLVDQGRIAAVGENLDVPADTATIDGRGQTLLPGLIDAHVHTWGEARRQMLRFTVSIGGYTFAGRKLAVDELLKAAEQALYAAKRNGRNQVDVRQDSPAHAG